MGRGIPLPESSKEWYLSLRKYVQAVILCYNLLQGNYADPHRQKQSIEAAILHMGSEASEV